MSDPPKSVGPAADTSAADPSKLDASKSNATLVDASSTDAVSASTVDASVDVSVVQPVIGDVPILDEPEAIKALVQRLLRASVIALDVEGDGLYVYRARLCTLQLAWFENDVVQVAVVDTLRVPPALLAPVLEASGPPKILHDLSFDGQLLSTVGITLGNVRDTSVCARFIGIQTLGLASLLSSELGISVTKGLQKHDWARRPITLEQLGYLANDVLHLVALDDVLRRRAAALDILDEVDDETAYKLDTALHPAEPRSPYLRLKGLSALKPVQQAVVRRVILLREAIAERLDVPPFHVASVELIQVIAKTLPTTEEQLARIRGVSGSKIPDELPRWLEAITQGIADGALSPADQLELEPPPFPRAEIERRRLIDERLRRWRRSEALARGVDEQVVLPGHCLNVLVSSGPTTLDELRVIRGIGRRRLERYAANILAGVTGTALTPGTPDGIWGLLDARGADNLPTGVRRCGVR